MFTWRTHKDYIFCLQPVHFNLIYNMQRRASEVYNIWDEGVKNVVLHGKYMRVLMFSASVVSIT